MLQAEIQRIDCGQRFRLSTADRPMSFEELFRKLAEDLTFVSWYNEILASANLVSFFWENPPLTADRLSENAEFVLVEAPSLTGLRADREIFRQHFVNAGEALTATFDNLSGDATLVAPSAIDGAEHCAHLASFVRGAPAKLICEFWQAVARDILLAVNDQPIWLSTSGLGVSWLHVRLDTVPKYYQYSPYKELDLMQGNKE